MIFKVTKQPYSGGYEYLVIRHDNGLEFSRGPALPVAIITALGDRNLAYFDWGYDSNSNTVDLVGNEVSEPAPTPTDKG